MSERVDQLESVLSMLANHAAGHVGDVELEAALAAVVKHPADVELRAGDSWEFATRHHGPVVREIHSVAWGIVTYYCTGRVRRCSIKSFRRWALRARLLEPFHVVNNETKSPNIVLCS